MGKLCGRLVRRLLCGLIPQGRDGTKGKGDASAVCARFPLESGVCADARATSARRQVPANTMLSDLEFAYAPVRDKVRDLREYL